MSSAADNPIPSPSPGLAWIDACTAQVNELLRELDHEGWDGGFAYPLDRQTAQLALKAAAEIAEKVPGCPQPCTVPTILGGIDHQWDDPASDTDLEINPDGRFNVYHRRKDGQGDPVDGTETEQDFADYDAAVSAAAGYLKARHG